MSCNTSFAVLLFIKYVEHTFLLIIQYSTRSFICIITVIKSKRMTQTDHVAHNITNAYKIFIYKPQDKKVLRKPRYRWENIIKTAPKGMGCKIADKTELPLNSG
jgi:hypothetical protein